MTVTEASANETLSAQVAAEIRAWMGRLDVRQSELARRLKETDQWVSMRLKGRTPIDLNELQRIASALGIEVGQLFPREGAGRTVVIAGEDRRQTTVPKVQVDVPHRPNGQMKRTAPNLATRRPGRVTAGNH